MLTRTAERYSDHRGSPYSTFADARPLTQVDANLGEYDASRSTGHLCAATASTLEEVRPSLVLVGA